MDRNSLRKQIQMEYTAIQKEYESNPTEELFNKREELLSKASFLRFEIYRTWDKNFKMISCFVADTN